MFVNVIHFGRVNRDAAGVTEGDLHRLVFVGVVFRVDDFHRRVDEEGRALGYEAVLEGGAGPVGDEQVRGVNGLMRGEVRLEDKPVTGLVGVFRFQCGHELRIALHKLRMRADDDFISGFIETVDQGLDAGFHNVARLMGRSDEDHRRIVFRDGHIGVIAKQAVKLAVAVLNQLLRLQLVFLFRLADLAHLVRADAEDGVEMVERGLAVGHRGAHQRVEDVNIFNVAADDGALDMVGLQVGHGHDDDRHVQLGEEGAEVLIADVIGDEVRLVHAENAVVRVAGDVMDDELRMMEQVIQDLGVVIIEAVLLGIEDDELIFRVHEAVAVVAFTQVELPFHFAAGFRLFAVVRFLGLRFGTGGVVDVFLRGVDFIQDRELYDCHQVRADPVKPDAGGDDEGEVEGKEDEEDRHAPLLQLALLTLQHVLMFLINAQRQRAQARDEGDEKCRARTVEGRGLGEMNAEEVEVHGLDLLESLRGEQPRITHRVRDAAVLNGFDDLQFGGAAGERRAESFTREGDERLRGLFRYTEKVLKRVVDDLDQAEDDRDLNGGRQAAEAGVVSLAFEELVLFLGNAFLVAVVELLDLVNLRLQFHHLDRILLHQQ